MKKSELRQIIKEEIKKVLKENENDKTINDPKIIKQNHNDYVDGFYVFKGGSSFEKGTSSRMGGKEYSQFDPDKAKAILYSPNENDIEEYKQDGYTIVSIIDGNPDIQKY